MQSRFFVLICDQAAFSLPICLVHVFSNLSVLHLYFSLVTFWLFCGLIGCNQPQLF